jgi:hypothetical protein
MENLLSYIGGMISLILTLGQFIMGWYNEVSLLKTIANNCYNFVEEGCYHDAQEEFDKSLQTRNEFKYGNLVCTIISARIWWHSITPASSHRSSTN